VIEGFFEMKLNIAEFSQFHLQGRWKLMSSKGLFLFQKNLGSEWVGLYSIFGFYVEVFFKNGQSTPFRVEPLLNSRMLEFYLEDISLHSLSEQLKVE
jgi:hypothetical protein